MMTEHGIPPVYNKDSTVLILGSFPSVKSRGSGFFYGHPQNRFWRVLARIKDVPVPATVEEKKALLLTQRIALWDVVAACEIEDESFAGRESERQLDLFGQMEGGGEDGAEDQSALEEEKKRQRVMLDIKKKYGKNAILKGMNFEEGATTRERNEQVGGHKA